MQLCFVENGAAIKGKIMKKLLNKKYIILGCVGVVAVIVLCVCLTLGKKDKTEEKDRKQGNQEEISTDINNKEENVPEIELPDDNFEHNFEEESSDKGIQDESENKDNDNNNENTNSNDSSDGSAIVLPEVPIP